MKDAYIAMMMSKQMKFATTVIPLMGQSIINVLNVEMDANPVYLKMSVLVVSTIFIQMMLEDAGNVLMVVYIVGILIHATFVSQVHSGMKRKKVVCLVESDVQIAWTEFAYHVNMACFQMKRKKLAPIALLIVMNAILLIFALHAHGVFTLMKKNQNACHAQKIVMIALQKINA